MNATIKQKRKAALLTQFGKMEIPVLQNPSMPIIQLQKFVNVKATQEAFTNNLKEAAKKEEFSEDVKRKYKDKFPQIESTKWKCTRHKSGCGEINQAEGPCITASCSNAWTLSIMQSLCMIYPITTIETSIPGRMVPVNSTIS